MTKGNWLRKGLNPEDFEKAWTAYCNSKRCEWCNSEYKSSRDKQMDHCHDFGHFRNILCQTCNGWRRDSKFICKSWDKQRNKYYYYINVKRNGKNILCNKRNTLEEAEEVLLEFKKNNGFYFPFWKE